MTALKAIEVSEKNGVHICNPTETRVRPGDTVAWVGEEPFLVFFPDETPLVEGRGPFGNAERATVKAGLPSGHRYKPLIQQGGRFLKKTEGDIIPV